MNSIKSGLKIVLINAIVLVALILAIEVSFNMYKKYGTNGLQEEFSSLLNNPCFEEFFGEKALEQRNIIMQSA